jgi:hypothetical protein
MCCDRVEPPGIVLHPRLEGKVSAKKMAAAGIARAQNPHIVFYWNNIETFCPVAVDHWNFLGRRKRKERGAHQT